MIERITEEVEKQGTELNERTLATLKENEKSIAAAAENYDMAVTIDAEGALIVQFSKNDAPITTYTFYKAFVNEKGESK